MREQVKKILESTDEAIKEAKKIMKEKAEALEAVKHACGVKSYFDIDDLKIYREARALDNQIDLLDEFIDRLERAKREFDEFLEAW